MKAWWIVCGVFIVTAGIVISCKNSPTEPQGPAAPSLVAPENNAPNQPASVVLQWEGIASATSYHVEVAGNSTFDSVVFERTGVTSESITVPLAGNHTYYWRVSASNNSGSSAWSSTWQFSTTEGVLAAPSLSAPINGAPNQANSLTLNWADVTGNTGYTVDVSQSSSFATTIASISTQSSVTSATISGLESGSTYYWHVATKSATSGGAWSAAWSFSTVGAPTAPALTQPATGATGQTLTPVVAWSPSAGAASYELQASTDPTFATTVFDQSDIAVNGATISGLSPSTTYYWQVRASNSAGTSAWSAGWSFTTLATTLEVPAAPALTAPANGASGQPTFQQISWAASNGATSYSLQVSTSSTFSSIIANQTGIGGTNATITNLANSATYYWQVSATNTAGTSAWSAMWSFSTITTPSVPQLASPTNNAKSQLATVALTWAPSTEASTYTVQVSANQNFTTTISSTSGITGTYLTTYNLAYAKTYFWRVNAVNDAAASAWSSTWTFFTIQTPVSPTPLNPTNGSAGTATSVPLNWSASADAAVYSLRVSTSAGFMSTVYANTGINATSAQLSGLAYGTTYYWQVNAVNDAGTSTWSTAWSFRTLTVPNAPVLKAPANGVLGQNNDLIVSWNSVDGAALYEIQVSTSADFANPVKNQTGLQTTSATLNDLDNGTKFYWRVNATNEAGKSVWSSVWNFTTIQTSPAPTTPSDGAVSQPTTLTLGWDALPGASNYNAQVSLRSDFSANIVSSQTGLTTSSATVTGLTVNRTYYWRASAVYPTGTSDWSTVRSFTTAQ